MARKFWLVLCLFRLHQPVGWLLLLWPHVWVLLVIGYMGQNQKNFPVSWVTSLPSWQDWLFFIIATVACRSLGCAINDYVDKKIDAHHWRTKHRPLASGALSSQTALWAIIVGFFFVLFLASFLRATSYWLVFVLAVGIVIYPFCKRFFVLPQVILALVFAGGIPLIWLQFSDNIPAVIGLLYGLTAIWIFAFDTLYALADASGDKVAKVYSSALTFGSFTLLLVQMCYAFMFFCLFVVGKLLEANRIYFLLIVATAVTVTIVQRIVRKKQEEIEFLWAFRQNNWVGLLLAFAFFSLYL